VCVCVCVCNGELQSVEIATEFKVVSRYFPRTEESSENLSHGIQSSGRDMNLGPPKHET
jgi:hypothetical protein